MYSLEWPFAYGSPQSSAQFKLSPDDFHVNELSTEQFSGQGEHILIKVEKRGLTTEDVVKSLSRSIDMPSKLISYAGLKDRQALTTQWLSIHAPGKEIENIGTLQGSGWRILEHTRHHKKLRSGYLLGNQFMVRLHDVSNSDALLSRIEHVKCAGVPNYFGEQRFGRDAGNLVKAEDLLVHGRKVKDRFLKGMYFSAARAWIYNLILSERVQQGNWNLPLTGDVMQLSGSHSIFCIDEVTEDLIQRIEAKDISPASPLPGKGKSIVQREALLLIQQVYEQWMPWIIGLEKQGLEEAWRANILYPEALQYTINGTTIELHFNLPAGAYATTLLRELVHV